MPRTAVTAVSAALRFNTVITLVAAALPGFCAAVGFVPGEAVSSMTASSAVVTDVAALGGKPFAAADGRMSTVAFVATQSRLVELFADVDLLPQWIEIVFDGRRWLNCLRLLIFRRSPSLLFAPRWIQYPLRSIRIAIQA